MIGQQFTCEKYPGDTLTVIKMYSTKQGVVHTENDGADILFHTSEFEEPHLSLAHVPKSHTLLTKKENLIKW